MSSAPICDHCQTPMQPTEAVVVLYQLLGRKGPKPTLANHFPWCCTTCEIVQTLPTTYPAKPVSD